MASYWQARCTSLDQFSWEYHLPNITHNILCMGSEMMRVGDQARASASCVPPSTDNGELMNVADMESSKQQL